MTAVHTANEAGWLKVACCLGGTRNVGSSSGPFPVDLGQPKY
jgi:hypothetical protein